MRVALATTTVQQVIARVVNRGFVVKAPVCQRDVKGESVLVSFMDMRVGTSMVPGSSSQVLDDWTLICKRTPDSDRS